MTQTSIEIPIMQSFDNNYVIPAAVSFSSMLSCANPDYFYKLYVLHSNITVQNQNKLLDLVKNFENASLEFINLNHQFNDIWKSSPRDRGYYSKELLYKLLVPSLFPQYKKLIITDVDVVFMGDIAPSYFVFDEHPEAYYAGVKHINPPGTFIRDYYNSNYKKLLDNEEYSQLKVCGGYLVANLELLREDGMEAVMIDYLTQNFVKLLQPEQDVINFCCRESQIVYLPLNFVVCSYMYDLCAKLSVCASDPHYTYKEMHEAMTHPIQLHFATKEKPWTNPGVLKAELWFNELMKTSFKKDYYNQVQARTEASNPSDCPCIEQRIDSNSIIKKKVSVLCCTYNHEHFIEAALEGILGQKTSFEYELIVADDASTDCTPKIITRFQAKYTDKMAKTILRKENIGIGENYYDALSRVEGEYLAICDGDDCWTDENKLQMQVDFLENHPEYTIVCTDFISHYMNDNTREDSLFSVIQYIGFRNDRYSLRDLISCRFIGSCTSMLRWQLKDSVPDFIRHYQVIDFPLMLIHASMGYIGVLEQSTARYNVHSSGVSNDKSADVSNQTIILLHEVNEFFDFRLTKLLDEFIAQSIAIPEELRVLENQAASMRKHLLVRMAKKLYHMLPLSIRDTLRSYFQRTHSSDVTI